MKGGKKKFLGHKIWQNNHTEKILLTYFIFIPQWGKHSKNFNCKNSIKNINKTQTVIEFSPLHT